MPRDTQAVPSQAASLIALRRQRLFSRIMIFDMHATLSATPSTREPDFSVVIPCFNERDNVLALVREIAQTCAGRHFEILVVDDASTVAVARLRALPGWAASAGATAAWNAASQADATAEPSTRPAASCGYVW